MRPVGLMSLAVLLAASVAGAQVPAGQPPGAPGAPPPAPAPNPAEAAARLDAHLNGWDQAMRQTINFRAEFTLTRQDAVFQRARTYAGSVLCMKPNLAILRLESTADKKDYEAYVCNGKAVFEYNGVNKTITEYPLPANAAPGQSDNLMLDFLSGMTAQAVKQRFQITVFKEDSNYVYLDIRPVLPKDKQEFEQIRFALFGPKVPAPFTAYLPVEVWMKKPNGDEERWRFSDQKTNLQGIAAANFQAQMVPGFAYKKAQIGGPAPAPGPMNPPKK
jgi:TIGR03009 family protein